MDFLYGRRIRYGYSVVRVRLDDPSDHNVPAGVVACQRELPVGTGGSGWSATRRCTVSIPRPGHSC